MLEDLILKRCGPGTDHDLAAQITFPRSSMLNGAGVLQAFFEEKFQGPPDPLDEILQNSGPFISPPQI
jgi:hypothetical protein